MHYDKVTLVVIGKHVTVCCLATAEMNARFGRGRWDVNFHLRKRDCWWSAGKTSEEQAGIGVEDSLCVPSLLLLFTFS